MVWYSYNLGFLFGHHRHRCHWWWSTLFLVECYGISFLWGFSKANIVNGIICSIWRSPFFAITGSSRLPLWSDTEDTVPVVMCLTLTMTREISHHHHHHTDNLLLTGQWIEAHAEVYPYKSLHRIKSAELVVLGICSCSVYVCCDSHCNIHVEWIIKNTLL